MLEDIERIIISKKEIKSKVKELGKTISKDYQNRNLLLVSILKGSVVFLADLIREINVPLSIDFICASSYGKDAFSSGKIQILKDLDVDVKGYDILIVEDILDSGNTLRYIIEMLQKRNPNSIKLCTLMNKSKQNGNKIKCDYEGFKIPNEFVVGYGLDYNEKYRNLSFIGILKPQIFENSKYIRSDFL